MTTFLNEQQDAFHYETEKDFANKILYKQGENKDFHDALFDTIFKSLAKALNEGNPTEGGALTTPGLGSFPSPKGKKKGKILPFLRGGTQPA